MAKPRLLGKGQVDSSCFRRGQGGPSGSAVLQGWAWAVAGEAPPLAPFWAGAAQLEGALRQGTLPASLHQEHPEGLAACAQGPIAAQVCDPALQAPAQRTLTMSSSQPGLLMFGLVLNPGALYH